MVTVGLEGTPWGLGEHSEVVLTVPNKVDVNLSLHGWRLVSHRDPALTSGE